MLFVKVSHCPFYTYMSQNFENSPRKLKIYIKFIEPVAFYWNNQV